MSFKEKIEEFKDFYFNEWRGNEKGAPAFSGEIIKVNRFGWSHIVYSEKRYRNASNILKRLKLLSAARKLIETINLFQDYRKVQNEEFWALQAVLEDIKLRVIIRSVNQKEKHFYSVFLIKQKNTNNNW